MRKVQIRRLSTSRVMVARPSVKDNPEDDTRTLSQYRTYQTLYQRPVVLGWCGAPVTLHHVDFVAQVDHVSTGHFEPTPTRPNRFTTCYFRLVDRNTMSAQEPFRGFASPLRLDLRPFGLTVVARQTSRGQCKSDVATPIVLLYKPRVISN